MKTFLNIFRTAGKIAQFAAPAVSVLVPGASLPIAIINGLIRAEQALPAPGSGATKSAMVIDEFEAGLETTKEILNAQGQDLLYDKATLQDAINHQVAALNAMQKVKDSFKIVPLQK
jgi:hypothetical protein